MGMGGLCLIGEFMKNLSELIDKHEEIFGDQSLRITSLPTMTELRMTEDEKRKKQKRDWYHENKEKVLEQQKNFKKKIQYGRSLKNIFDHMARNDDMLVLLIVNMCNNIQSKLDQILS